MRQPVGSVRVAQGGTELLEEEGVGNGESGGCRVRLLQGAFVEWAARSGGTRLDGQFSAARSVHRPRLC